MSVPAGGTIFVMVVTPVRPVLMLPMVMGIGLLASCPMPVPAVAMVPFRRTVEAMHPDHWPLSCPEASHALRCCLCAREGCSSCQHSS